MNTTTTTETELSSVNSILMAIGQAPITRIFNEENGNLVYINPEVAIAHSILMEVNVDVQNEGWVWNTEQHYPLLPDSDGCIYIPNNVLRMDRWNNGDVRTTNVVRRGNKLYDKLNHTYIFDTDKAFLYDIVWLWEYETLPSVFKRYITLRASGRAATQMVTNPSLVQLLATQEQQARAACMEYECNQADVSYFGTPDGSIYRPFQPYHGLRR